jgi:hypothetical protein
MRTLLKGSYKTLMKLAFVRTAWESATWIALRNHRVPEGRLPRFGWHRGGLS